MAQNSGLDILDYLVLAAKRKRLLLAVAGTVALLSYVTILVFVPNEYRASATIVPTEDNSLGSLSALMKSVSSLPLGLGGAKKTTEMDLYTTIVKSRSTIESLIQEFHLDTLYHWKSMEDAVKEVRDLIEVDVTTENAYVINVRSRTPRLAADLTNAVVRRINDKIIELNVAKSRENRIFLEQRTREIRADVRAAEDSLKWYQSTQGIYEAKEQVKATLAALTELEGQLAVRQVEFALVRKIYGEDSPQFSNAQVSVNEFAAKLMDLKKGKDPSALLLAIDKIPAKALNYFRLYREVEIGNKLLEFIIPLYEQAKFEEKKQTPILQIIDEAVPPIKRAYPKRLLMSLIITVAAVLATLLYLIGRELFAQSTNPRVIFIRRELFSFRKRP
jgi:tyrosine-protein kinase Etk/Wzc